MTGDAHREDIRRAVRMYLDQSRDAASFDDICRHMTARGFRIVDTEMFKEWLGSQRLLPPEPTEKANA